MYIPAAFRVDDRNSLHDLMDRQRFATLVTNIDDSPFATHLPLILNRTQGENGTLLGHVAKANPHWNGFSEEEESLAIFHGPHAYISPNWYGDRMVSVPTWNYAVVHAYGTVKVCTGNAWLTSLLNQMSETFEQGFDEPWTNELPSDLNEKLLLSIVGFELTITRLEGKFKLGQNRSEGDQRRVLTAMGKNGEVEIAELMRLHSPDNLEE